MNTEILNEYIFANLVYQHAERIKQRRLKDDPNAIDAVTDDDYEEGFDCLQTARVLTKRMQENSEEIE